MRTPQDPATPGEWLERATRWDGENRTEDARQAYETFLSMEPTHLGAWTNLGGLLMVMGRLEEALAAHQKALELAPGYLPAITNLAQTLRQLGRIDEAEFHARRALVKAPGNPDALLALADICMDKQDLPRARKALEQILALQPAHPPAQSRLNNLLIHQRDWAELRKGWERELQVHTGPELEYERSLLGLLFGEMPEAWEASENRLLVPGRITPVRAFKEPKWKGESFEGKTLLVHYEQGFGDTLMFLRYLPMVKALGGILLLLIQPQLADLAATCEGADQIIREGDPLPPFDQQISLMSLPAVFRTELATIPASIPYLRVPEQAPHRGALSELLSLAKAHGRVRIGLVWAGNPLHRMDAQRSLSAEALAPLGALPGVAWFSLQLGKQDTPPLPGLVSLAPFLGSFADTAYALSELDLLITVDTSVAHLAGSLGVPTIVLVSFVPSFRWLLDRDDSPWYPTLQIYRQPLPDDWSAVIQRLATHLASALEGRA